VGLNVRQVLVWDIATRLFHWFLVALVTICLLTGEDEGLAFIIHAYAGFVIIPLLFFRAGWGIFGSQHSRFADFLYSWPATKGYALSLLRLKPTHFVGHNPLGGWMIILMLVALTATALSGVLMVANGATWLEDIHEAIGSFMQILVFVHIGGVLVDQLLSGEKIVQAMITSRKELAEESTMREAPPAGWAKALIFAVLIVIGATCLFQKVDYLEKVSTFAASDHDAEVHKKGDD
jgi:cytochrome b